MRIKTALFWLSAFAIALLSIIITLYTIPPSITSISNAISSQDSFYQLAVFNKVVKQSGLEDFLSHIVYRRQRHHRRKPSRRCDKRKWNSRLVSIYKVALILTVDLKGCANFSSLQKAVDAVPENSPTRTLIIIDSGTYRSLSHTKFSTLFFLIIRKAKGLSIMKLVAC